MKEFSSLSFERINRSSGKTVLIQVTQVAAVCWDWGMVLKMFF